MTPKELSAKLEAVAAALPGVERKRMPGGYALFARGKIFANVTLDGRLGVKLPVAWCFEELAALPGAGPWKLGQKLMEGWVLVPESFHQSDDVLCEWVTRAHGCVTGTIPASRPEQAIFEDDDGGPPTARSRDEDASNSSARLMVPPPRREAPAIIVDDEAPPAAASSAPAIPSRPRSSRSLLPAPPSSRNGFDLSSYAPPPPSSLGIRVVPRDSKSPYEETLIGVPAPSSSNTGGLEEKKDAAAQPKKG